MAEKEGRRWSLHINPSDLALEIISIVIAIVLATSVGQIVANYQAGVHTREALQRIRQEVASDDATLLGCKRYISAWKSHSQQPSVGRRADG